MRLEPTPLGAVISRQRLSTDKGVERLSADHVWVPRLTQPVPSGGSRDFQ